VPISYRVDTGHRRIESRGTGMVTYDEVRSHLEAEEREEVLGYEEIFDARDAATDLTRDQVRRLVSLTETLRRTPRLGPAAQPESA